MPLVLIIVFVILGAAIRVYPFNKAWDKTADGFVWLGRKIKNVLPWKKKAAIKPEQFLPEGKKTANYLVGITKKIDGEARLSTMLVLSYDSRDNSASMVYLPGNLMVNAPGIGNDVLSNLIELDEGRISMALVTVENLLGVEMDSYVLATDRDLSIGLKKLGWKFEVDVPGKVDFDDPSLNTKVDLKPGKQMLQGGQLASYLTYAVPDKELDLIERQEGFVPIFLKESKNHFDTILTFVKNQADLVDSDASYKELAGMWQTLSLANAGKIAQKTVPVKEFRMEKTVVYIIDRKKLPEFVDKYVKSESTIKQSDRADIEILNGCGEPGIGEKVAAQLDMNKFRIVNSGNADNFNYAETLIIVYTDDKDVVSAAEEIRNRLEVGHLEPSENIQSIVDISVIVGKDYTAK